MSSALPALLCAPPRCGNQSLGIKISSLKYPTTSLGIPHPHPTPRLPSPYPMHPSYPPPLSPTPNSSFHSSAQSFLYPPTNPPSCAISVPTEIRNLVLRHRLRDSESCPLLSSPRTQISPSPTVSPSTEILNPILRHCFQEPESHTPLMSSAPEPESGMYLPDI